MPTLNIPRSKWHRGKEAAEKDAFIHNKTTGKSDIMGFILLNMGYDAEQLHGQRLPSVIAHQVLPRNHLFPRPYQWITTTSHADTEDTLEVIKINDDPALKEEERESKLTQKLGRLGISLVFLDDKPYLKHEDFVSFLDVIEVPDIEFDDDEAEREDLL